MMGWKLLSFNAIALLICTIMCGLFVSQSSAQDNSLCKDAPDGNLCGPLSFCKNNLCVGMGGLLG
jgi:hypothetical protein